MLRHGTDLDRPAEVPDMGESLPPLYLYFVLSSEHS